MALTSRRPNSITQLEAQFHRRHLLWRRTWVQGGINWFLFGGTSDMLLDGNWRWQLSNPAMRMAPRVWRSGGLTAQVARWQGSLCLQRGGVGKDEVSKQNDRRDVE